MERQARLLLERPHLNKNLILIMLNKRGSKVGPRQELMMRVSIKQVKVISQDLVQIVFLSLSDLLVTIFLDKLKVFVFKIFPVIILLKPK